MSVPSPEQILADLAQILRQFNGREYSGPLGPETLFFGDLGMASIDAVVLAETLEEHYGRKFPFQQFLSELGHLGARDLELGRLAAFLHRHWPRREGEG
jgi:acyl carrier protein